MDLRAHRGCFETLQRKLDLPDLFLAISLGAIAIEAALGGLSLIKARYRPKPRACSADALRAACRAASLIVSPIR